MSFPQTRSHQPLSPAALTMLGAESVAYVRAIRSEDVGFIHAEAPLLPPGRLVYVLTAGDGTPMVIAESLEAVFADAASYEIETVSIH